MNNTPFALDIYSKLIALPTIKKQMQDYTCFVIKILNYDLLLTLLTGAELQIVMGEIQYIVTSTMLQTPYRIKNGCIVDSEGYIAFVVNKAAPPVVNQLVYLIYHNIQLHISDIHQNIHFECKISNVDLEISAKNHEEVLHNLFCNLAHNKNTNYYLEFTHNSVNEIYSTSANLNILKQSLRDNTFSFAYQPVVDRVTGDICYYECLLRIPNKDLDVVSAGPFISIAESAGLNNVIDQVVLNMAVNELKAAPGISLAVNISNSGVGDANLLKVARSLLSNKSIAKRLVVEITETSLNLDFNKTKNFIDIIRGFGCRLALDDFGTGFASFKQLQNLPIDIIKIDGSFIRDVVRNKRDQHLVIALIELAKNLGAKTVAEFVENGEIARFLLEVGVDCMQGNFFSPAMNYRSWMRK